MFPEGFPGAGTAFSLLSPPGGGAPSNLLAQPGTLPGLSAPRAGPFGHLTSHKLQQELRAKNQDALLRLREMALEEKVRTELAWTDQRQG